MIGENDTIFNFLRLRDRITTSGQPTEQQLAALKNDGITTIINLAPHDHPQSLDAETEICEGLGLNYINIPVAFDAPTQESYARFRQEMGRHTGEHIHVHCIVNARVTAFFYKYDQETGLLTEQQARTQMEKIWKPGGIWAEFIGDDERIGEDHLYAGRDYPRPAD